MQLYLLPFCLLEFVLFVFIVQEIKGDRHLHPSNIGELFSEGSLNPYADDPYAFD